ncbi:hypothetical protein [Halobacterium yunchengense]
MPVVERLRERFRDAGPPQVECGLCAARYERRPPNCPACGSTEFRDA